MNVSEKKSQLATVYGMRMRDRQRDEVSMKKKLHNKTRLWDLYLSKKLYQQFIQF